MDQHQRAGELPGQQAQCRLLLMFLHRVRPELLQPPRRLFGTQAAGRRGKTGLQLGRLQAPRLLGGHVLGNSGGKGRGGRHGRLTS